MNDYADWGLWIAPQYYALHYSITSIIRARFIFRQRWRRRSASGSAKESAVYLRPSPNRSEQAKFKQGSTKDRGDAQAESSYSGSGLSISGGRHRKRCDRAESRG